jgi:hypothetical protein
VGNAFDGGGSAGLESTGNPKAAAWDHIGAMFWERGRPTARPSPAEIALFLGSGGQATPLRIAVIGASTIDLIVTATAHGSVTALDFSQGMCLALASELSRRTICGCQVRLLDITATLPNALIGQFDLVVSDRLLNRFTEAECLRALRNMISLLRTRGVLRTSVRLGLYPMDRVLMDLAEEMPGQANFFDPATGTIDYAAAGAVLEAGVQPHGEIPRGALLAWYRGRGAEKRYEDHEIRDLFERANGGVGAVTSFPLPDAEATVMYSFTAP